MAITAGSDDAHSPTNAYILAVMGRVAVCLLTWYRLFAYM